MESELKQFELLWNKYVHMLPIQCYEMDQYLQIIEQIRREDYNFSSYTCLHFIELINRMIGTICGIKYKEFYEEEKDYGCDDITCCIQLINLLLRT
jgi:hypothetical protein